MSRTLPQNNYAPVSGAAYDRCFTPWHGAAPLLPYLPPQSRIWECCAGDGWLAKWLEEDGHTVIQTDYVTGQDALTWAPEPADYDVIITNPPWSMKYKFIKRLYELGKPWALLVPFSTISVPSATGVRDAHGGKWEELRLDKRINFSMPNSGFVNAGAQVMSMWLCFGLLPAPVVDAKLPEPRPEHRLIKPPKKPKITRDDIIAWVAQQMPGSPEAVADLIIEAMKGKVPIVAPNHQIDIYEYIAAQG